MIQIGSTVNLIMTLLYIDSYGDADGNASKLGGQ